MCHCWEYRGCRWQGGDCERHRVINVRRELQVWKAFRCENVKMGRIRTGTLCSVSDSVDVGKSEQVVETAKCKTGVVS